MMMKHSRRRFIGQLFAASIGSAALNRAAAATYDDSNDGLAELCVITREPGNHPSAVVDVWTGQIGTLDLAQLPKQLGRAVVWDDIRGAKGLSQSIAEILSAIEEYFVFKPILGSNAAAHVGSSGGLFSSIEMLFKQFEPASLYATGPRTAVVDLSSCGLTRLHWLDIIPLLRRHYTHIVGVDYSFPDLCELDSEFEPPHGLSALARSTLRACDYWLLASDQSLAGRAELSIEERSHEFVMAIRDLGFSLASSDRDRHIAMRSLAEHRFVTFGVRA
ncbi:hypothetical protein [Bradyrhizobium acaciae]|uniref:hypothetical protein n=1 Tax=Bradyrhizobium acaciae TaxID=2683706 RepID=UPI001E335E4A|nr:hypothetical protein [Bradyrhizobium acaciae]MCC8978666.1 hypothetical protein [Bradyrhizobium acaciae]